MSFEERFANLGRGIDRLIEGARNRRPRRFERRGGPSLREQVDERVRVTREFIKDGEWKRAFDIDESRRRRLKVLGGVLVLALLVAGPWWVVRSLSAAPTKQEIIDQAVVKVRLELAAQAQQADMGSWGAGPGSGARSESGQRKWGP